ncbi:MAG: hypothetical protein PHV32_00530 [Eubacteriales bacterium]|nr:hypothetical protein [Eubacteriales bacterium]
MKTKLIMHMPEALDARDVEITGVIVLPDQEYQSLLANGQLPERYMNRLNKYTKAVTPPGSTMISSYKTLLVLNESDENGVAVCGRDQVSYAAVFPCAKEILKNRIKQMADFVCSLKNLPDYNSHRVPLEMLGDYANIIVTAENGVGDLLLQELQERSEVTNIIMMEDCIEVNYYLDNVQDCVESGERVMTLMGLIGCNLEDVHLCHADEDHDLATVVELNQNTLTEQGKQDWADVLAAKVERIYIGSYGLQIGLSGCDADRLCDFSFMLAGQCSCKDYDMWVQQGDTEQAQSDSHAGMEM